MEAATQREPDCPERQHTGNQWCFYTHCWQQPTEKENFICKEWDLLTADLKKNQFVALIKNFTKIQNQLKEKTKADKTVNSSYGKKSYHNM